MSDIIVILMVIVISCILVIGGAASIILPVSFYNCKQESEMLHLKTKWGIFVGCIVTLKDGQILTQDQFDNYYRVNSAQ